MIHQTENGYSISSGEVWLPGIYADRQTANYAFRFRDEDLKALQDSVNPDGVITHEMLQALRKAKPEVYRKGRTDSHD